MPPPTTYTEKYKLGKSPMGVMESNHDIHKDDGETCDRKVRFSTDSSVNHKFNPSHITCIPNIQKIRYKDPRERAPEVVAPASSLVRPNYEDLLKRVSVVLHKHITTCEDRYRNSTPGSDETGLFHCSKMEMFAEDNFIVPVYMYHFVRLPAVRVGFCHCMRKLQSTYSVPSLHDVHTFLHKLFGEAQLSAECSIVCLIYVERLMELANVPLMSKTWRPVVMCGLLLASKVWQDLSSWNSEVAQIFPQFTLQNINLLERIFCHNIKWDLYISSSLYAKYYFALRSLMEKTDFRRNYNTMVLEAPGAEQVAIRSENVREVMLHTTLSRSY